MIKKIHATKSYRYCTSGLSTAKNLLYVLHGYGQLAPYFIRKFVAQEDYFIVAPEGMHRFYLNGSSGRVGASWMTKEERLDDIEDNCNWLCELHSQITRENKFEKIIVLGFSQGGATAARWYFDQRMNADHLIMWASVFPPDLNPDELLKKDGKGHHFVLGTEDEYFDQEEQKQAIAFYTEHGFKTTQFVGKHDICLSTLTQILNQFK